MSPQEFFLHLFFWRYLLLQWHLTPVSCLENPMDGGAWWAIQFMGPLRVGHDWATSLSCIGEKNGNPLQCSCLENPRDGGAWWAAVYGVAQSQTQLKQFSSSSSSFHSFCFQFPHMLPVCSWRLWTINTWSSQITFAVRSRARITHESYIIQETEQTGRVWSFSLLF